MYKIWSILDYQYKRNFFIIFILICIGIFFETMGVGLIVPVVNIAAAGENSLPDFLKNNDVIYKLIEEKSLLFYSIILFLVFFILRTCILLIIEYYKQRFVYSLQRNLSYKLFSRYLSNDYEFFLKSNSSIFIRNIITEIGILANVTQSFLIIISEILVCLALFALMSFFEPLATMITASIMLAGALSFYLIVKNNVAKWGYERHEFDAYRIKNLQQGFGSIKEILISNSQKFFLNSFKKNTYKTMESGRKQNTVLQMPRLLLELLAIFSLVLIAFILINNDKSSSEVAGSLALFAAAAFRLMPSANRILTAAQTLRYAKAVTNTIHDEIKNHSEFNETSHNIAKIENANIVFNEVSFSYDEADSQTLNNINLNINDNSTVAFIGPSGSGKSTLVDLILGVLKPTSGKITVNNNEIKNILLDWQSSIGYVPQDIYLNDETLRENIAFGVESSLIDDKRIQKCIDLANLKDFVDELPLGINTKVGERGARISGGQLQRVGIARALYKEPSVLILDEATSALDSNTEKKIMDAVFNLSGEMTIIIIAHRLSTIQSCDYLYELENGNIVSHDRPAKILKGRK